MATATYKVQIIPQLDTSSLRATATAIKDSFSQAKINPSIDTANLKTEANKAFSSIKDSFSNKIGIDADFGSLKEKAKSTFADIKNSLKESLNFDQIANFTVAGLATQGITSALSSVGEAYDKVIEKGSEFQTGLASVSAVTGVSGAALDDIGQRARNLAKEFGGEAKGQLEVFQVTLSKIGPQLAQDSTALETFAKNVNVLSKTDAALGAAGAVDALTGAMLQFGVNVNDSNEVARESSRFINVLAASAAVGSASVSDVAAAVAVAGGKASQVKVGFEEMNAALQVMASRSITGAPAGTALTAVFTKLTNATGPAADRLGSLGTSTEELGKILTTKGLAAAMERFRQATMNIADETQRAAFENEFFGETGSGAAAALLDGSDTLKQWTKEVTGTSSAYEQAQVNMNTFAEASARATAKFDDLFIGIFLAIEPTLSKVTSLLTDVFFGSIELIQKGFTSASEGVSFFFNSIANSPAAQLVTGFFTGIYNSILSIIPPTKQVGDSFNTALGIIATFAPFLAGIAAGVITYQIAVNAALIAETYHNAVLSAKFAILSAQVAIQNGLIAVQTAYNVVVGLGSTILAGATSALALLSSGQALATIKTGLLSTAQGILNAIMTANPIGIVVVAVAGLVAGLVLAYQKSETFRAVIDSLWKKVKEFAATVLGAAEAVAKFFGFGNEKKEVKVEAKVQANSEEAKKEIASTKISIAQVDASIQQLSANKSKLTAKEISDEKGKLANQLAQLEKNGEISHDIYKAKIDQLEALTKKEKAKHDTEKKHLKDIKDELKKQTDGYDFEAKKTLELIKQSKATAEMTAAQEDRKLSTKEILDFANQEIDVIQKQRDQYQKLYDERLAKAKTLKDKDAIKAELEGKIVAFDTTLANQKKTVVEVQAKLKLSPEERAKFEQEFTTKQLELKVKLGLANESDLIGNNLANLESQISDITKKIGDSTKGQIEKVNEAEASKLAKAKADYEQAFKDVSAEGAGFLSLELKEQLDQVDATYQRMVSKIKKSSDEERKIISSRVGDENDITEKEYADLQLKLLGLKSQSLDLQSKLSEQKEKERIGRIVDDEERAREIALAEAKKTYDEKLKLANGNKALEYQATIEYIKKQNQAEETYAKAKYSILASLQDSFVSTVQDNIGKMDFFGDNGLKESIKSNIDEISKETEKLRESYKKREIDRKQFYDNLKSLEDKRREQEQALLNTQKSFVGELKNALLTTLQQVNQQSKNSLLSNANDYAKTQDQISRINDAFAKKEQERDQAQKEGKIEKVNELNKELQVLSDSRIKSESKANDLLTESFVNMGAVVGGSLIELATTGKTSIKSLVLSLLSALEAMIPIFAAQIAGGALATPQSILSGNAIGIAQFIGASILLKGLAALARAGVAQMTFAKGGEFGIDRRKGGLLDSAQRTVQVTYNENGKEFFMNHVATAKNLTHLTEINSRNISLEEYIRTNHRMREFAKSIVKNEIIREHQSFTIQRSNSISNIEKVASSRSPIVTEKIQQITIVKNEMNADLQEFMSDFKTFMKESKKFKTKGRLEVLVKGNQKEFVKVPGAINLEVSRL